VLDAAARAGSARRVATSLAALIIALPAAAAPIFQGLGAWVPSPTAGPTSTAQAVSADGRVVVGQSDGQAFRWTAATGMQSIGGPTGFGTARGVSADGSVIVGDSGGQAFRWTQPTGMQFLGSNTRVAYDVSGDGNVVVGDAGIGATTGQGFRWTPGTGVQPLGTAAPGVTNGSTIFGVSQDGQALVGQTITAPGQLTGLATRWTEADGYGPGGGFPTMNGSYANAASADGTFVVGRSGTFGQSNPLFAAFIWSEDTGSIHLGSPEPEALSYISVDALSVSGDGSIVVGTASRTGNTGADKAIIWSEDEGIRYLQDVLVDLGLDLSGWTLTHAHDISADGTVIVGQGINPLGVQEAWIVTIPEPATALLLGCGLVVLACGRTRRDLA
jgi:hypothetical protein